MKYYKRFEMLSAITSSAVGNPSAATAVGIGPLVAAAIVVGLATLVAGHSVPAQGAIADVSAALPKLSASRF